MAFADRSCSTSQDVQEISRFSCLLLLSGRGFSDYPGSVHPLAFYGVAVWPSSSRNGVGILFLRLFEAPSPGPPIPLSTLQPTPHDAACKTQARMDSLLSFPVGLFHPLQHAGLARRTPCGRPTGGHNTEAIYQYDPMTAECWSFSHFWNPMLALRAIAEDEEAEGPYRPWDVNSHVSQPPEAGIAALQSRRSHPDDGTE
jgi:hypothetical protein